MTRPVIHTAHDLRAYFRDEMHATMKRQKLRLSDETEFYLVSLLDAFGRTEELYQRGEDGRLDERPLAFLLKDALEASGPARIRGLKRLGDTSLVVSGFFSDRLARRPVDVDYYIGMGEQAYEGAAALARKPGLLSALRAIFEELARRFSAVVDCLMEVSERACTTASDDLIRTLERFHATGSGRLARQLVSAGMMPTARSIKNGS